MNEVESLLPYPGVRGGQFHTNCSWPADLQFHLTRAKQADESLLPYPGVRGGQFHTFCSWPTDLQFRLTRAKQAADRLAVIRQLGRQPTAVGSRQAKLQLVSPTRARNLDHLMCQLVFI